MRVLEARISRCGYPGAFELRNISLDLDEGEILLVTGRSGSGKTTLVRALTGTIRIAGGFLEGYVKIFERDIHEMVPEKVFQLVAYIPQEPWYAVLGYTTYAEICHTLSLKGLSCSEADLVFLGLNTFAQKPVHTLSSGQVQRVLWADAVVKGARLLVLDEPLVYLDEVSRKSARHVVEEAIRDGVAVVIVDHNPAFWSYLEPRMIVLDSGRCVYSGRWRPDLVPEHPRFERSRKSSERDVLVSLKGVWFKYPGEKSFVLKDLSAEFRKSVFTAIKGPNGSGKTTLLKIASGVLKPLKGTVSRLGRCTYIPENPILYFTMPTPRDELLAAARGNENRVLEVAEVLGLKHVLDQPIAKISTGERRRVALASASLAGFDAYFVDEPTGGLDAYSAELVLELINMLVDRGRAVVAATHDERALKNAGEILELGVP